MAKAIEALRITLTGQVVQEHVKIYSHFLGGGMPPHEDLFEDSQLIIVCKHGKFAVPDYNVVLVQLHNKRVRAPAACARHPMKPQEQGWLSLPRRKPEEQEEAVSRLPSAQS